LLQQSIAARIQFVEPIGASSIDGRLQFLERHGAVIVGVNLLIDDPDPDERERRLRPAVEAIFDVAISLGGTITGEHGVGCAQSRYLKLCRNPVALAAMRGIKDAFDPSDGFLLDTGSTPNTCANATDGSTAVEPTMDPEHVAQAVVHMAGLPLDANVQFMTIMATKMPFIGRG